ncbi:MAG: AtpZ/AtpI family protein [Nocardioides sp.]
MTQRLPSPAPGDAHQDGPGNTPRGDPWHAFGYLVSGVLIYGLLGWSVDRWLGTTFVVVIGILLGAALGIYMTYARFNRPWQARRSTGQDQS